MIMMPSISSAEADRIEPSPPAGESTLQTQRNSQKLNRKRQRSATPTGFIVACLAPAVILFLVFLIYPTLRVFWMSLYKMSPYSDEQTFVGLKNFQALMEDAQFIKSFQNTVLLVVVVTIITFAFAVVFASILVREKVKGQDFYRIIFYVPNILSIVVVSAIFSAIYSPENGLLNSFLSLFTSDDVVIAWKGENLVMLSLVVAMVWQAIGYYMVMYMASIASVPESLYESASLDGASSFRQFFTITVPLIWTNIRTTLTFFIISNINMAFLFVTAMTSGGPNGKSEVILTYMYTQSYTQAQYGYGMAIGVVLFLFSFVLAALVNKVTEREVLEF